MGFAWPSGVAWGACAGPTRCSSVPSYAAAVGYAEGGLLAVGARRVADTVSWALAPDTPPPATAKDARKTALGEDPVEAGKRAGRELAEASERFPVRLYTSPSCKDPCDGARAALNGRGVPFEEAQVWDARSNEALRQLSGSNQVPLLAVGDSLVRGFDAPAFERALDAAGYPRKGLLPPGSQGAPERPAGYAAPGALSETAPAAGRTPPPR